MWNIPNVGCLIAIAAWVTAFAPSVSAQPEHAKSVPLQPATVSFTAAHSVSLQNIAIVGSEFVEHQFSERIQWRQPPSPELSARSALFFANRSDVPITWNGDLRWDGSSAQELIEAGAWSWREDDADQGFTLPPSALRVVRWNGRSAAWGMGTKHRVGTTGGGEELDFEIRKPELWIESVLFLAPPNASLPDRMLVNLRNRSMQRYRMMSCRLW